MKKRAIKSVSSSIRDEMQKKEDRKPDDVLYKDNYCTVLYYTLSLMWLCLCE